MDILPDVRILERREMNEILIARLATIKFPSNHLSNKL